MQHRACLSASAQGQRCLLSEVPAAQRILHGGVGGGQGCSLTWYLWSAQQGGEAGGVWEEDTVSFTLRNLL